MDLEVIIFPWVKVIKKKILRSFPVVNEKILHLLFDNIHEELKNLDWTDTYRSEVFYEVLSYFYYYFSWKVHWNEETSLQSSCVQILYYMTYVGLILSCGNVDSQWLDKVLSSFYSFPGYSNIICDVLLLIRNIPGKYLSAYRKILSYILIDENVRNPADAECFIKIMLLFRRFKSLHKADEKASKKDVYNLASKINCPVDAVHFLSTVNNDEECCFTDKNIVKKFLDKSLKSTFIKNLFEILFRNKYDERIINCSTNLKRRSQNVSVVKNNHRVCSDDTNKSKPNRKKHSHSIAAADVIEDNECIEATLVSETPYNKPLSSPARVKNNNLEYLDENKVCSDDTNKPKLKRKKRSYSNASADVIEDNGCVETKFVYETPYNKPLSSPVRAKSNNLEYLDESKVCSDDTNKSKPKRKKHSHSNAAADVIETNGCVEAKIASEKSYNKPLSSPVRAKSNNLEYLDENIPHSVQKLDIKKCIYSTPDASLKQKMLSSSELGICDYKYDASPESLDLNVSSFISESSKQDILERSRSIYTTTSDSFKSLSSEESSESQESIIPKERKRKKKCIRRNLSKEFLSSDSSSDEENVSNGTRNINNFGAEIADMASLKDRLRPISSNSDLLSEQLPSETKPESPNKLIDSDNKCETEQKQVEVPPESKICSFSNENFIDSNKVLRSQTKSTVSTTCNKMDDTLSIPKCKTSETANISSFKMQSDDVYPKEAVNLASDKSLEESASKCHDVDNQQTQCEKSLHSKVNLMNNSHKKVAKKRRNKKQRVARKNLCKSNSDSGNEINVLNNETIKTSDTSTHNVVKTPVESCEKSPLKDNGIESVPKLAPDLCPLIKSENFSKCFDSEKESNEILVANNDSQKREFKKLSVIIEEPTLDASSDSCYELKEPNPSSEESELNSDSSDELNIPKKVAFKPSFYSPMKIPSKNVHLSQDETVNSPELHLNNCTDSAKQNKKYDCLQKTENNCMESQDNLANETVDKNKTNLANETVDKNKTNLANETVDKSKTNLAYETVDKNNTNFANETFGKNDTNLTNETVDKNNTNLANQTVYENNANSGKKKFRQQLIFEFLSKPKQVSQNNNEELVSKRQNVLENVNLPVFHDSVSSPLKTQSDISFQTQQSNITSESSLNLTEIKKLSSSQCISDDKQKRLGQTQNVFPISSTCSNQNVNLNDKDNINRNKLQNFTETTDNSSGVETSLINLNQGVDNSCNLNSNDFDSSSKDGAKKFNKRKKGKLGKHAVLNNTSQEMVEKSNDDDVWPKLNLEKCDKHTDNFLLSKNPDHILDKNVPILTKEVHIVFQDCRAFNNFPKLQDDTELNKNESSLRAELNSDQLVSLKASLTDHMPKSTYQTEDENLNGLQISVENGSLASNYLSNSKEMERKLHNLNTSESGHAMSSDVIPNKLNQLEVNEPNCIPHMQDFSVKENSKSSIQPSALSNEMYNEVSFENILSPLKGPNHIKKLHATQKYTPNKTQKNRGSLGDLTQSCQNTPEKNSSGNASSLNSSIKQTFDSFVEGQQVEKNLAVCEDNLNSSCSSNMSSPIKFSAFQKGKKNMLDSDSDWDEDNAVKNISNDSVVLKNAVRNKSSNTTSNFSASTPKKSRKIISESESDADDCLNADDHSEGDMTESYLNNSVNSLNRRTSKSDSISSSEKHTLDSSRSLLNESRHKVDPKSFIDFSASEDDRDDCPSESELDDFIVSDNYMSEDYSEQESNSNASSTISPCPSTNSKLKLKGKSRKKWKNIKVASESENESSEDDNSTINAHKTMSRSTKLNKNKILSESESDSLCDRDLSNDTKLTQRKKPKPKNAKVSKLTKCTRNNSSQSKYSLTDGTQDAVFSSVENLSVSHSKGSKRKLNNSAVSSPLCQKPYSLRKRKLGSDLKNADVLLESDRVVSVNQSASTNNNVGDINYALANSDNSSAKICSEDFIPRHSLRDASNNLQASSVLKLNCDKTKKVSIRHCPEKSATPKRILRSNKKYSTVSDSDSDKTCLLQNVSVIEKQSSIGISEKDSSFNEDQHTPGNTKVLKKFGNSTSFSSESPKTINSKMDFSNNILIKGKTVTSTNDNKKRSCLKVHTRKQNASKNRKQMQEFSVGSTDSLESNVKDKNLELSAHENRDSSDSFECVPPTQIQKNVLKNSASDLSGCVAPTQIQMNGMKNSASSDLSGCVPPIQIQMNSMKHSASSDFSSFVAPTQIQMNSMKHSASSDLSGCVAPTQIQMNSMKHSASFDLSECIPPTLIKKNILTNSNLLTLSGFNAFDKYQKESDALPNENICSLNHQSENILKENSSDRNLSLFLCKGLHLELGNVNLDASVQNNENVPEISKCTLSPYKCYNHEDACNPFLKKCINPDKTEDNLQKNNLLKLFESQSLLEPAKDVSDLSCNKTESFPDICSSNKTLNNLLFSNKKNSVNVVNCEKDKENSLHEFSIDSCDERLLYSLMDKLQSDSDLIADNYLKDAVIENFIEPTCEQNLTNQPTCDNQHAKLPILCKDNGEVKQSSLSPPESIVNKSNLCSVHSSHIMQDLQLLQSAQKASCDAIPSDKSLSVNTNCNNSASQTASLNLDTCIELIQGQKMNPEGSEFQSNSSNLNLDEQLSQMGFEMIPDSRMNVTQTQNVACSSQDTVKSLPQQSNVPKNSEKILLLFDVQKQSYEICVLPEAPLLNILNKPRVMHSESQTNVSDIDENLTSQNKNVDETKKNANGCTTKEYISVNGLKLPKASLSPVVNLGRRCDDDDDEVLSSSVYSSRTRQRNKKVVKRSTRQRKNNLCKYPKCH